MLVYQRVLFLFPPKKKTNPLSKQNGIDIVLRTYLFNIVELV